MLVKGATGCFRHQIINNHGIDYVSTGKNSQLTVPILWWEFNTTRVNQTTHISRWIPSLLIVIFIICGFFYIRIRSSPFRNIFLKSIPWIDIESELKTTPGSILWYVYYSSKGSLLYFILCKKWYALFFYNALNALSDVIMGAMAS